MTKRGKQLLNIGVYLLIVLAVSASCMGMLVGLPFVASVERYLADYRIAYLTPPEPQDSGIIFIGITDETLAQFPYRTPIDRHFLSDLLKTLEARGVKGVLLDVLLDQPTEEDKDAEFKKTITEFKVPLAISYARGAPLDDDQQDYEDDFVPLALRGFANIGTDRIDETVRWIYPGDKLPDGTFIPGVAARLYEDLTGKQAPRNQIWLRYRGRKDADAPPFPEYPAHNIKVLNPDWFKDKIAVVGADESLIDRYRSPFAARFEGNLGKLPGALFHAYGLAQLLDGRQAPEVGWQSKLALILVCATVGVLLGRIPMGVPLRVGAGLLIVALIVGGGFEAFSYFYILLPIVTPSLATGLALWATDAYTGRQERDQKKFIQAAFSKYLSPALLDEMVNDPTKLSLDAKRREMTFIFTDVAGFTTISEKMDARALSIVLNEYFNGMCKIIFEHGGTVDKFIGDAVFAIFNAPKETEEHARNAVACALKLDGFCYSFYQEQIAKGRRFGITRIGVHCGWASVGNFGSDERFEYTALGDAVNTAARLEGLNKYFGTRLCVSGGTLGAEFDLPHRPLGLIVLKGKTEALEIVEPLTDERSASDFISSYRQAYALLEKGDPGAEPILRQLAQQEPDDGAVKLYLERIESGLMSNYIEMHDK